MFIMLLQIAVKIVIKEYINWSHIATQVKAKE